MTNTIGSQTTKGKTYKNRNTLETLKNSRNSGILDQFFGNYDTDFPREDTFGWPKESAKTPGKSRQEFTVFNYQNYYEKEIVRKEIKQLSEQITKEIEMIKKADASLINDVKDVENLTINGLPEKPGIYHIRFLELVLNILRTLRAKVGESKTWLQALMSKKKKRGSAFVVRSKKQGTQYSMSQELSNSRSVQ